MNVTEKSVSALYLEPYIGWLVEYDRGLSWKQLVVDQIRGPWTYEGVERIGITDKTKDGPWAGVEYIVETSTLFRLIKPLRPKAKRIATSIHKRQGGSDADSH